MQGLFAKNETNSPAERSIDVFEAPYIFFDLDGTITNSAEGILNAIRYALNKMGYPIPSQKELYSFIGPPLARQFSLVCGMPPEVANRALATYREYYFARGVYECSLYDGYPELFPALRNAGKTLVLATCKPTVLAERVLAHFDLRQYFAFLSGPELDGTRGEKHEVIAYAMQTLGISDPHDVVMLGDRDNDVLGARQNGVAAVGALWGFGSEEELSRAGAAALIRHPSDLLTLPASLL